MNFCVDSAIATAAAAAADRAINTMFSLEMSNQMSFVHMLTANTDE